MAEITNISWCHHTFNPWIGCTKVSPGCKNCYAEAQMSKWLRRVEWGPQGERIRTSAANWLKPFAWDRKAGEAGERRRVFCASLADVFDDKAPEGALTDLWTTIADTPMLDWLLLTKRPERIAAELPEDWVTCDWPHGWPNVWLGISAEDQERYDERFPILAEIPAVVRFVSAEPLLGPIHLTPVTTAPKVLPDWIIAGGESGGNYRPMQPLWPRMLRDQCAAGGIAFWYKQGNAVRSGQHELLDGVGYHRLPTPSVAAI